jgi:hypothetical protein
VLQDLLAFRLEFLVKRRVLQQVGCWRRQVTVIMTGCISWYKTMICNPWLSGFTCYSKTFRLSFCPVLRLDFRDEVSFRPRCHLPKDLDQFQIIRSRSSVFSEALWLNRWKNVSGFIDLLSIADRSPFAQASALLMRSPEGLNEPDFVSVK